jgi:ArsR family transcriptional regulator
MSSAEVVMGFSFIGNFRFELISEIYDMMEPKSTPRCDERRILAMKSIAGLTTDEERAAAIFRALGNPARVRIVSELSKRATCMTSDLVDVLPLAQSTVSEHLRVLKDAGIVKGQVDGDQCYCVDEDTMRWLSQFCTDICCPPELLGTLINRSCCCDGEDCGC